MKANVLEHLNIYTYKEYERLGDELISVNPNQAYLCYENAVFLCDDENAVKLLLKKKERIVEEKIITVNKACFIIVSYNNKKLMKECLDSIVKTCSPEAYSLVVIDNASVDGVTEMLKEWPDGDMDLILSDENLGFPVGCNVASTYAPDGHDIFLLNNDTQITPNALFWLRMGLYESDDIGAVGALQNYSYPDQRVEIYFDDINDYQLYGARNNVYMECPYEEKAKLNGFAMLIKRKVFDSLGGFDDQFSPGYFEDDDLSFRIRQEGYKLNLCHNSFIYHRGSQSFISRPDLKELFEKNRKKFIDKWGFDSSIYAMMRPKELELIESLVSEGYTTETRFKVLYIGAGCGNSLSRIQYMFPHAEIVGIEDNEAAVRMAISKFPIYPTSMMNRIQINDFDMIITNDRDHQ